MDFPTLCAQLSSYVGYLHMKNAETRRGNDKNGSSSLQHWSTPRLIYVVVHVQCLLLGIGLVIQVGLYHIGTVALRFNLKPIVLYTS